MKNFFDSWGMLAQGEPKRDGGDSCQRMGMYHFGAIIREKIGVSNQGWDRHQYAFYDLALSKLMNAKGDLRRHPDESMWYSHWDRASRDQTVPFLCACGIIGGRFRGYVWRYIRSHAKRLFWLTTNWKPNWVYPPGDSRHIEFDWTPWKRIKFFFGWRPMNEKGEKERVYGTKLADITFMEFWSLEIRALNLWFLWPLLCVLDVPAFFSALYWRFGRKNDNDNLNSIISFVFCSFKLPTPTMWIACKIIDWTDMQRRLLRYFYSDPYSIMPMVDFYLPINVYMKEKYND